MTEETPKVTGLLDREVPDFQPWVDDTGAVTIRGFLAKPDYLQSYAVACALLFKTAKEAGRLGELVLPVFYMQRHTVELALKELIGHAYDIESYRLCFDATDSAENVEIWKERLADKKTLLTTHDLKRLYRIARSELRSYDAKDALAEARDIVTMIEGFERGVPERSRYERIYKSNGKSPFQNSLPSGMDDEVKIDSGNLQAKIEHLIHAHITFRSPHEDPQNLYEELAEAYEHAARDDFYKWEHP